MAQWLFVVTGKKADGRDYLPLDILGTRFKDGIWGLGENTPNRKHLAQGDLVVFYAALPRKEFVATATLASDSRRLSSSEKKEFGHGSEVYSAEYGVFLRDQLVWERPVAADQVVNQLDFIENKQYWYSYFQGGVRRLSALDFKIITEGRERSLSDQIRDEQDIESESEFALAAHLEEFLDQNWHHIHFGANLERYVAEEQTGRQFPAGPWSIDFLCVDKGSGDFVVIELKRGKSSDSTVGQVLRYLGWVEENLVAGGQKVRGIIICREVDDALKYAVRSLDNVQVMTYKVDFELRAAD